MHVSLTGGEHILQNVCFAAAEEIILHFFAFDTHIMNNKMCFQLQLKGIKILKLTKHRNPNHNKI
jgi:hypothetical protein